MNTARRSSKQESTMGCSTGLPSSETSRAPISDHWPGWWILSLRDSRASPTPSPGSGGERLTNGTSGPTPLESFGRWDRETCCWRTYQASLLTGMGAPWSGSFPKQGMTVSGVAFRLRPLVPRTSVGAGGVSLPTPDAGVSTRSNRSASPGVAMRPLLGMMAKTGLWPSPMPSDVDGGRTTKGKKRQNEGGLRKAVLWPTPGASKAATDTTLAASGDGRDKPNKPGWAVALWPTPKGSPDHYGQPRENDRGDLQAAALTWPTPTAHRQDMGTLELARYSATDRRKKGIKYDPAVGGQLNPRWVEWLMGVPIGWVSLEPLGMESFQQWLQGF